MYKVTIQRGDVTITVEESSDQTAFEGRIMAKFDAITLQLDQLDTVTNGIAQGVDGVQAELKKLVAQLTAAANSDGTTADQAQQIADRLSVATAKLNPIVDSLTAMGKDPEIPIGIPNPPVDPNPVPPATNPPATSGPTGEPTTKETTPIGGAIGGGSAPSNNPPSQGGLPTPPDA